MNSNFQFFGNKEKLKSSPLLLTLGNFDGVHLGHKHILNYIRDLKKENESFAVVTFDPHPIFYFDKNKKNYLIYSLEYRIQELLKICDVVIVQKFIDDFANQSHEEFCQNWLLKNFHPRKVFLGFNFTYGKNRLGNSETFEKFASKNRIQFETLPAYKHKEEFISSSLIRKAILKNDFLLVQELLAQPFFIDGIVIHGDKRGRQIGFPTANIKIDEKRILPQNGVYACRVQIENEMNQYHAVMNIGVRPTVQQEVLEIHVEAHLFDYNGDLYGKKIKYFPVQFIREERKFSNFLELKEQIKLDSEKSKIILGEK